MSPQRKRSAPSQTFIQSRLADPAVAVADIAHCITNSVMPAIAKEMFRQGVEGGLEPGLKLRDSIQLDVLPARYGRDP